MAYTWYWMSSKLAFSGRPSSISATAALGLFVAVGGEGMAGW